MGFFDDLGGIIRGTAPYGDPIAPLIGDKLDPNGAKGTDYDAQVPPIDPRIIALRDQQLKQATDFRSNLGNYKEQQGTAAADNARRQLATELSGVKSRSNARGLLYSGLREGSEAQTRAKIGSGLNQRQAEMGQSADEQANALENRAIQSGLGVQNLAQQREDQIAKRKLAAEQQKNQGFGQFAGGIGGVLGGMG